MVGARLCDQDRICGIHRINRPACPGIVCAIDIDDIPKLDEFLRSKLSTDYHLKNLMRSPKKSDITMKDISKENIEKLNSYYKDDFLLLEKYNLIQ